MEPEIDYLEKLALQLAGLAQIRDWVGGAAGWPFWLSLALLAAAALATLAALVFLAQSIWPARFRYVTSELELQTYLETVRTTAAASGSSADQATQAAVLAARTVMVQQYAIGASSNRLINQGRANRRTRAGARHARIRVRRAGSCGSGCGIQSAWTWNSQQRATGWGPIARRCRIWTRVA